LKPTDVTNKIGADSVLSELIDYRKGIARPHSTDATDAIAPDALRL